jgi:hypothetical protein
LLDNDTPLDDVLPSVLSEPLTGLTLSHDASVFTAVAGIFSGFIVKVPELFVLVVT